MKKTARIRELERQLEEMTRFNAAGREQAVKWEKAAKFEHARAENYRVTVMCLSQMMNEYRVDLCNRTDWLKEAVR